MDTNEIYLGNYVAVYEILRQVDEKLLKELPHYDPNDVKPIIISEEWLLALGFEKTVQPDMTRYYRLKEDDLLFEVVFPKRKTKAIYIYKNDNLIRYYVREEHFMIHILQNAFEEFTRKKLKKE